MADSICGHTHLILKRRRRAAVQKAFAKTGDKKLAKNFDLWLGSLFGGEYYTEGEMPTAEQEIFTITINNAHNDTVEVVTERLAKFLEDGSYVHIDGNESADFGESRLYVKGGTVFDVTPQVVWPTLDELGAVDLKRGDIVEATCVITDKLGLNRDLHIHAVPGTLGVVLEDDFDPKWPVIAWKGPGGSGTCNTDPSTFKKYTGRVICVVD
jgi:hypothetical protein